MPAQIPSGGSLVPGGGGGGGGGGGAGFGNSFNQFNTQFNQLNASFRSTTTITANLNQAFTSMNASLTNIERSAQRANSHLSTLFKLLVAYASIRTVTGFATSTAGAATPNGLDSVNKAFTLLSGTIGSLVLPFFVTLGSVAMMLSTRLQAWIDANLDQIIEGWGDAIEGATDAIIDFTDWLEKAPGGAGNIGRGIGQLGQGALAGGNANLIGQGIGNIFGGAQNVVPGGIVPKDKSMFPFLQTVEERTKEIKKGELMLEGAQNAREIIKDMRSSMVQSSIQDPAAKWKEVALQIQRSILDQKLLDMQERNIRQLERNTEALENRANMLIRGDPGRRKAVR